MRAAHCRLRRDIALRYAVIRVADKVEGWLGEALASAANEWNATIPDRLKHKREVTNIDRPTI